MSTAVLLGKRDNITTSIEDMSGESRGTDPCLPLMLIWSSLSVMWPPFAVTPQMMGEEACPWACSSRPPAHASTRSLTTNWSNACRKIPMWPSISTTPPSTAARWTSWAIVWRTATAGITRTTVDVTPLRPLPFHATAPSVTPSSLSSSSPWPPLPAS